MSAPDTITLADLRTRAFPHPQLGVLGDPIAHSLSPAMHNAALEALRPAHPTLATFRYLRLHITAAELPAALLRLRELGFAGLNLTVPHKIQAITLVTELSDEARRAASVNTLVPTPQGWAGHTTDGQGFLEALREHSGHGVSGRPVRLLGAGGAARAVAAACLAAGCSELRIVNRDTAKGEALVAALADPRARAGDSPSLPTEAVIVNCTTLGLKPDDASPLSAALLCPGQFVFDTTYGAHPSQLLRDAAARGVKGCDGRSMLRWQGALAFQLWTGIMPPAAPMRAALGEPPVTP
jgi:shikimate dehydrogenase